MSIKPKWQCGSCNELHDFEDEAKDCCRPEVFEVYLCPICKEDYDDEDSALSCCNEQIAAELTVDDGKVFPTGTQDPSEYIKTFCEKNHLRI